MSDFPQSRPTRRKVLQWLATGAAGGAGAALVPGCSRHLQHGQEGGPSATGNKTTKKSFVPHDKRLLVLIELVGGNDGLSVLVPRADGRYHDMRPSLALDGAEVFDIGHDMALNTSLAGMYRHGMAVVAGIGCRSPTLSHFDMRLRWNAGTPELPGGGNAKTGFLGRLCDRIGGVSQFTGVSLNRYGTSGLLSTRPNTVALSATDATRPFLHESANAQTYFRQALTSLGAATDGGSGFEASRGAIARVVELEQRIVALPPAVGYEVGGEASAPFRSQLQLASRLLRSGADVRVIHIPIAGADFDTHVNHRERHSLLMNIVAEGVEAFRADLQASGLAERVLIATMSEFGRRPQEGAGGLDHGTASCAMLMGPVVAGLHGEQPSLRALDSSDNLVATVSFARYLATMAAWLDIDPGSVLDGGPKPLDGLLAQ